METQPLVMERSYNAPVKKVWDAITDAGQMRQWYFDIRAFEPVPGYKFSFTCIMDNKEYIHHCEVMEADAPTKLTYSWRYEGFEGNSFVTFELFPEGEGTKLVLTHKNLESFPPMDEFRRGSFVEGWTELLGKSLKEYVENATVNI